MPDLVFEPQSLEFGTTKETQEVELHNVGFGCLQVYDVEIVQTNAGEVAFHPGQRWFETAEFRQDDRLLLQVQWRDVNDGIDEGELLISTNDPHFEQGILAIPLVGQRSESEAENQ